MARMIPIHLPLCQLDNAGADPNTVEKGGTAYMKWELIEKTFPDRGLRAVHIGCNNGFFSL